MLIFVNHDDMRSLELMEELLRRGYYVSDQFKDLKFAEVIYLGVKGIDRKHRLYVKNGTVVIPNYVIENWNKKTRVYTLIENEYLRELSKTNCFQYISLLSHEDFLNKNSILTAEGLISYLIEHRRFPLYQSRILVLGYGHCAKPIISYLLAFHAQVSVGLRNHSLKDEIESIGCQYTNLNHLDMNQDIIINTIPHVIIDKEKIDQMSKQCFVIDIASYPYGIDHHYALSQGYHCQILPSIPCKYAYGYAGKMIADEIEKGNENA